MVAERQTNLHQVTIYSFHGVKQPTRNRFRLSYSFCLHLLAVSFTTKCFMLITSHSIDFIKINVS